MITLFGDRSPDQPAHESSYRATRLGMDPDRFGERATISSEPQLSVVVLDLYCAPELIQDQGSRSRAGESIGFRGGVPDRKLLSHLAHQASKLGGVHLAGQDLEQPRQHWRVGLGQPLLALWTDGVDLGGFSAGAAPFGRNYETVALEDRDVVPHGVSCEAECVGKLLNGAAALSEQGDDLSLAAFQKAPVPVPCRHWLSSSVAPL
jgi:hypothetical protein